MVRISSDSILDEIEKRKVVPIPRWHFLLRRISFWILAVISVITGSISMATGIYIFFDNDFIVDRANINRLFAQKPFIEDIVISIPYIWLTALALFILVAYYGFRHTKKGYRYPTTRVIAGSLLLSLLCSLCLNAIDIGKITHRYLIDNVQGYDKLVYANEQRWSRSEQGLLGGKVVQYTKPGTILVLRDFKKNLWQVDLSTAEVRPGTLLLPGKHLKITGVKTGKRTFHARSIQAWSKKYRKQQVRSAPPKTPEKALQDTTRH